MVLHHFTITFAFVDRLAWFFPITVRDTKSFGLLDLRVCVVLLLQTVIALNRFLYHFFVN